MKIWYALGHRIIFAILLFAISGLLIPQFSYAQSNSEIIVTDSGVRESGDKVWFDWKLGTTDGGGYTGQGIYSMKIEYCCWDDAPQTVYELVDAYGGGVSVWVYGPSSYYYQGPYSAKIIGVYAANDSPYHYVGDGDELFYPVTTTEPTSETFTSVKSGTWSSSDTWKDSNGNPGVPESGDEKTIKVGHTVTMSSSVSNSGLVQIDGTLINSGELTNNGKITISNSGDLTNKGTITNLAAGSITNGGSIGNSGTINNNLDGTIISTGSITNIKDGTITNTGTIENNYGTITNLSSGTITNLSGGSINNDEGTITNTGASTIKNYGIITSDRDSSTIDNVGIITNFSGGRIIIDGTIINTGTINNNSDGTMTITITATIKNDSGGTINNYGIIASDGIIENDSGGTITNFSGGIIINSSGGITNEGTIISTGTINNNYSIENNGIINNNLGGIIENNNLITNNFGGIITNNFGGIIKNSGKIFDCGEYTGTLPSENQITACSTTETDVTSIPESDVTTTINNDGSVTTTYPDGKSVTKYDNGNTDTIYPDGRRVIDFVDGHIDIYLPDGTYTRIIEGIKTTVHPDETITTEYPDGIVTIEHPDGTTTREYPDGSSDITHPDETITTIIVKSDGTKIKSEPDGTVTTTYPDKTIIIEFQGHTVSITRTAPDGTTTTEYPDGTTTTDASPVLSSPLTLDVQIGGGSNLLALGQASFSGNSAAGDHIEVDVYDSDDMLVGSEPVFADSDGSWQSSIFDDLGNGDYTVIVTDGGNFQEFAEFTITGNNSVLSNDDDLGPVKKSAFPSQQKQVFQWWSQGLVSDEEAMNGLVYLVEIGAIQSPKIQISGYDGRTTVDSAYDSVGTVTRSTNDELGQILTRTDLYGRTLENDKETSKTVYEIQKLNESYVLRFLNIKSAESDIFNDAADQAWEQYSKNKNLPLQNQAVEIEDIARQTNNDVKEVGELYKNTKDLVETAKADAIDVGNHVLDLEKDIAEIIGDDHPKKLKTNEEIEDAYKTNEKVSKQIERMIDGIESEKAKFGTAKTKGELDAYVQKWEEKLQSVGDDAQLANVDLQNMLQKQQQVLQMMSNISKMLHDSGMALVNKLGS